MRYTITLLSASLAAPALADAPRVMTDVPVVQSLAAQVMGDLGTPGLLLDRGGDPHSFQLRPTQARALEEAELLFWVGAGLTPWLQRAIDGIGVSGEIVTLFEVPGLHRMDFAFGHDDHGHDDHGHDEHGHDEPAHDHDHSHDGLDPHAWMNTANAQVWLDVIAAELAGHDPANAETYASNAAAAKARIDVLADEVAATLSPVGDAALVMFHDAYGYLADQFGLNLAGTIALGDAAAPGAQRLAELRAQLSRDGVVCIFPEVNHSSRYVDVVVEGTGVRIAAELDPAGVLLKPGAELYATLMRDLATRIADCVTDAN